MTYFLKTDKGRIVTRDNKGVILKGVNFGGWLMMEAYILGAANHPEKMFRREFAAALGKKALEDFDRSFRENFITEKDIAGIRRWGFNCVRVPFHYRVVEDAPFSYRGTGLKYLDKVIDWAGKYKIWVILDLHAAPGAQNHDWHSDSGGEAALWTKKDYRERVFALWEFLADRYRNEAAVAGYDLLNESVVGDSKLLNNFYKALMKRIRAADKNHVLFIEGNRWATDIECLEQFDDDNYALSIHSYEPLDFTFNFIPHLRYPAPGPEGLGDRRAMRERLFRRAQTARRRGVPVLVGEFGVNSRGGLFGEDLWLKDMLACFQESGFHWTYWTYKAVKNSCFPDGLFSYYENPGWVHRQGPVSGWETYASCWKSCRNDMIGSWDTDRFRANTAILKILTGALR